MHSVVMWSLQSTIGESMPVCLYIPQSFEMERYIVEVDR